jgi:hypothetical protein
MSGELTLEVPPLLLGSSREAGDLVPSREGGRGIILAGGVDSGGKRAPA